MKKAKRYSGSLPLQKCVKFKVDRLETLQKHSLIILETKTGNGALWHEGASEQ